MGHKLMMLVCGTAIFLSGCSQPQSSDLTVLQGTWKGQEKGRPNQGTNSLTISGNSLEFRGADTNEWYKGSFILREDSDPKQLIGMVAECPAPKYVGKTVNAIYKIEAGTLTLTAHEPGKAQVPAGFTAPATRTFVLTKP